MDAIKRGSDWELYTRSYFVYLPLFLVRRIADALGRPLEKTDLEYLVSPDGEKLVCSECGQRFQPMFRVLISEQFLTAVRQSRKLITGPIRNMAAYHYIDWRSGRPTVATACIEDRAGVVCLAAALNANINPRTKRPNRSMSEKEANVLLGQIQANYVRSSLTRRQRRAA